MEHSAHTEQALATESEANEETEEDLVAWTKELSFDEYHDRWEQLARLQ